MKKILFLLSFITVGFTAGAQINSSDTVIFDLSRASCVGTYFTVPVSFKSNDVIYAIDFSMKYNQGKITYNSMINHYPATVSTGANYSISDSTLRFTSFCMTSMAHDTPIASIRFNLLLSPVIVSDFNTVQAYLNGDVCSYKIIPPTLATIAASGPTVIASGDTLSLIGTPGNGLTYLWSTGSNTPAINITTPGVYTVTVTTGGGCSSIASISITGSSLPVELVNFTATEDHSTILIGWTTASEINNDYFTVERTVDGSLWEDLEKIPGGGNTNTLRHYSITDTQPYPGINYYRLMQTDFDGTFAYSQIVAVNFTQQEHLLSVNVFPNPAGEMLNITATEAATHQLFNASGQLVVLLPNVPAGSRQQISIGNLTGGIYTLKIFNTNGSVIKKVVVRNK